MRLGRLVVAAFRRVVAALQNNALGIGHLKRGQRWIKRVHGLEFPHRHRFELSGIALVNGSDHLRMPGHHVGVHFHPVAHGSKR